MCAWAASRCAAGTGAVLLGLPALARAQTVPAPQARESGQRAPCQACGNASDGGRQAGRSGEHARWLPETTRAAAALAATRAERRRAVAGARRGTACAARRTHGRGLGPACSSALEGPRFRDFHDFAPLPHGRAHAVGAIAGAARAEERPAHRRLAAGAGARASRRSGRPTGAPSTSRWCAATSLRRLSTLSQLVPTALARGLRRTSCTT